MRWSMISPLSFTGSFSWAARILLLIRVSPFRSVPDVVSLGLASAVQAGCPSKISPLMAVYGNPRTNTLVQRAFCHLMCMTDVTRQLTLSLLCSDWRNLQPTCSLRYVVNIELPRMKQLRYRTSQATILA